MINKLKQLMIENGVTNGWYKGTLEEGQKVDIVMEFNTSGEYNKHDEVIGKSANVWEELSKLIDVEDEDVVGFDILDQFPLENRESYVKDYERVVTDGK